MTWRFGERNMNTTDRYKFLAEGFTNQFSLLLVFSTGYFRWWCPEWGWHEVDTFCLKHTQPLTVAKRMTHGNFSRMIHGNFSVCCTEEADFYPPEYPSKCWAFPTPSSLADRNLNKHCTDLMQSLKIPMKFFKSGSNTLEISLEQ